MDPSLLGASWVDGTVATPAGDVPRVRTVLDVRDALGTVLTRLGAGRAAYRVPPGLYAVGAPGDASPVALSANYKLSFDCLRRALHGRDAWMLVLDTKGVNVWCAAGKGTFGTDEVVRRVRAAGLDRVVRHRDLVAPQLCATGVSAREVRRQCGFRVLFGPVRAEDLGPFLDAGMEATPTQRTVSFTLRDRAVLIPVEVVLGARTAALAAALLVLLGGLGCDGYSLASVRAHGLPAAAVAAAAFMAGTVLGPLLLPWLPGRAFAVKGAALGLALAGGLALGAWPGSWLHAAAFALMVTAATSHLVLNFTGCTTFTSLSGVLLELRYALPAQRTAGALGAGLWVLGLFTR